jgi:replication-associated recombination protein RarA
MITYLGREFPDARTARASVLEFAAGPALAVADAEPPMPVAPMLERRRDEQKRQPLVRKYRPRTLAEVAGQPTAVAALSKFVAAPYPWCFIFAGDTGTGKTSAAWALAAELGCDIDASPPEFGGVFSIPSGEHNAASVRDVWPTLSLTPMGSERGWKVLIVNEVEQVSALVEILWLDRLEDIPTKTVAIFTTNAIENLPARFRDRPEILVFEAAADRLDGPARGLARQIWRQETGEDCPPAIVQTIVDRATQAGRVSFRRVVQNIVPLLAARK